jgi:hypothetical protein
MPTENEKGIGQEPDGSGKRKEQKSQKEKKAKKEECEKHVNSCSVFAFTPFLYKTV